MLRSKHGEDDRHERTEPKEILFHRRLTVANMAIDAKCLKARRAKPEGSVDFASPGDRSGRRIRIVQ